MVTEEERSLFAEAIGKVVRFNDSEKSIGTYNEKMIHKVLKQFFDPDVSHHEVPLGDYVADIKNNDSIIEIQTSGFQAIKNRLDFFLDSNEVTIVYPVIARKYLVWVDPESGAGQSPILTHKKGKAVHILPELFRLGELFNDPKLTVKCVLLEATEYRLQDGWGNNGKRGAHRIDRVPSDLIDIETISEANDVRRLIPFAKDDKFTAKDFYRECGFSYKSTRDISMSLKFLQLSGIIERYSKTGNAIVYRVI